MRRRASDGGGRTASDGGSGIPLEAPRHGARAAGAPCTPSSVRRRWGRQPGRCRGSRERGPEVQAWQDHRAAAPEESRDPTASGCEGSGRGAAPLASGVGRSVPGLTGCVRGREDKRVACPRGENGAGGGRGTRILLSQGAEFVEAPGAHLRGRSYQKVISRDSETD